ncbi:DUF1499 domain-containing protein [bacterium]|jgi:uncharacterized protein (DUF1499 family)|nr:DUF1499 domain-containing protein [bacterium]
MKIIGFLGQALMVWMCMVALALELDVIQLQYKLLFVIFCVGSGTLVATFGAGALIIRYAQDKYVPTDFVLLLVVCFCPAALTLYVFGIKGLLAPPLNDISTDIVNPPALTYAAATRTQIHQPVEFPSHTSALQTAAYPDIKPFHVPLPARDAYSLSLYVGTLLGWSIVYDNLAKGDINLQEKTRFLAFKSDIAIRVTPVDEDYSIIDIRSAAMEVEWDFGSNAERIRAFVAKFGTELEKRRSTEI